MLRHENGAGTSRATKGRLGINTTGHEMADGQAPLRSYNMFPESVEKLGHSFQSTRKILVTLMKLLI